MSNFTSVSQFTSMYPIAAASTTHALAVPIADPSVFSSGRATVPLAPICYIYLCCGRLPSVWRFFWMCFSPKLKQTSFAKQYFSCSGSLFVRNLFAASTVSVLCFTNVTWFASEKCFTAVSNVSQSLNFAPNSMAAISQTETRLTTRNECKQNQTFSFEIGHAHRCSKPCSDRSIATVHVP